MKKISTFIIVFLAITTTYAQVTVTATAGTPGPIIYTTLKGAFDKIIDGTHQGAITIGISANTTETASAALTASGVGSAVYTSVLISPTAANVTISGNATPLINLNGAKNVTIDGRQGQTGSTKDLTIAAITATTNVAIQYVNEATTNAVRYCTITSVNTGTSSGTIVFSTVAAGTVGNSSNTIEYCDIKPGATNLVANALYSSGTSTGKNSANVIQFNNFIDFYASGTTTAITLASNSDAWTVKGNSFYWTTSKAAVAATTSVISVTSTAHTIDGNYIGGTAPLCGGTPLTFTTPTTQRFRGISVTTSTSASVCMVKNNIIDNIVFVTTSATAATPGTWCGIYCATGNVDVKDNRIGSDGATATITLTLSTTGGVAMPICINSVGANYSYNITGNTIAGIKALGTSTSVGHGIDAIRMDGALTTGSPVYNISNNTIGSLTNANSIWAATACTSTAVQSVAGISNITTATSGTPSITFNNNTIANLTNSAASAASTVCQTRGIVSTSGAGTVNGNTIRDLNNAALYNGSSSGSMNVIGIAVSGAYAVNINQNTIYNLLATASSAASTAATSCAGIWSGNTVGATNVIERNHIYNINSASVFAGSSFLYGMNITGSGASTTIQNNIIRLGFNNDNTGNTKIYSRYYGINESTGTNKYYHNTIYIGGSVVGAAIPTACAVLGSSNNKTVRNNIFQNIRASDDVSLASSNIGLVLNASGTRTISNNDYYIAGANGGIGILGAASGTPVQTLSAWQTAIAADAKSINVQPTYISATDLHLVNTVGTNCGIKGGGIAAVSTNDYDNGSRSSTIPTIGADEISGTSPSTSVLAGTATVCEGTAANLTTTITGGVSPYTVIHSGGTVPSYTSAANIPVTPTMTTMYTLTSVTDAEGCVATFPSGTPTVTVNSRPTTAVLAGDATICVGASTNLTTTITGGTGPYSVVYSGGTVPSYTSGANIPVSPTMTTMYTLTSVTDANLCVATTPSGTPTVTVNSANAATTTGNWSNLATWATCGVVPVSLSDVTIPTGVTITLDVANPTINSLTFTGGGKLQLGSNSITVNNGVTGDAAAGYVVTNGAGQLKQLINAGVTKTFPIGNTDMTYSPMSATPTSTTTFGASVANSIDPLHVLSPAAMAVAGSREWDLSSTTPSGTVLAFTPNDGRTAPAGAVKLGHWNGSAWDADIAATYSGGTFTGTGSTFSPYIAAEALAALSVEFTNITAQAKGSMNVINFATATEKDVKEFAIERSIDNRTWEVIGTKAAIGGASGANYSFNDVNPSTLSYYRVRSIEANGKDQISKIVAVKRNGGKLAVNMVSPVPTTEGVNVDFSTSKIGTLNVVITDIVGKVVKTERFTTVEGNNLMRLNLSNLAQGSYILSLNDGETIATQRIVKQ